MPVKWEDLQSILRTDFTLLNAFEVIKKSEGIWKNILEQKQDLAKSLENDDNDRQKILGWINPLLYNSNKSNCGSRLTTERIISLCCISGVSYLK